MYTVLNSCRNGDSLSYACADFSAGGVIEVVSEEDLRLLISLGMAAKTSSGETVTVQGGSLVCNVEEMDTSEEDTEQDDDDAWWGAEDEDAGVEDIDDTEIEGEAVPDGQDTEDTWWGDEGDADECEGEADEEPIWYGDEDDMDVYSPGATEVQKLYNMLTAEQITVLRRYYLWYSQRLFVSSSAAANYGMKRQDNAERKRQAIESIKQGGDWRYAGFLDTGSKQAGYHCAFNHPLRYVHLAWDITVGDIETAFFGQNYDADFEAVIHTNNCIQFGIKCIGDFFDVDQDCLDALRRTQNQTLKDLVLLYQIYTTEDVNAVSHSFDLLDSILQITDVHDIKAKIAKKTDPIVPFSVSAFYHQFRKADLIPPKSLVQEIRSCLMGWTDGTKFFSNKWSGELKMPRPVFYDRLKLIVGKSNSDVVDKLSSSAYDAGVLGYRSLWMFVYLMFAYEMCGYYKYTATKEGFHEEGGHSMRVANQFKSYYRYSLHTKFEGAGFDVKTLKSLVALAQFCISVSDTYKEVPTVKRFGGSSHYDIPVQFDFYGRPGSTLSSMIKDFCATGEDANQVYRLIKFMSNFVFDQNDALSSLLKQSTLSGDKELKSCMISPKVTDLEKLSEKSGVAVQEFEAMLARFSAFADAQFVQAESEHQQKLEEQRQEEERKKAEKAARKAEEEARRAQAPTIAAPVDKLGVVQYLSTAGVGSLPDSQWSFHKSVLATLVNNGKEPSERQFVYIQKMYEAVSGQKYTGAGAIAEKVKLEDRADIKAAIDWIEANPVPAEVVAQAQGVVNYKKTLDILSSIKRYGTISDRQMKYAEVALAIAKEGQN